MRKAAGRMVASSFFSFKVNMIPLRLSSFRLYTNHMSSGGGGGGGGTSLSVIARKAAECVVASSFWFQGKYDSTPFFLVISSCVFQGRMANVSVCERAEGSRTCGGSPFWRRDARGMEKKG
ncbi:hypothetical protein N7471_006335 [Penicillium samsonianum]|uniref:uncharacterized protein n=1 Tax=Penicillium samsonianum TaxID=1882272 RepID=UPI0025499B2D|nr:uncharacterized protein N7471_006335 [Penicillium samsonianum]KAJ6139849.1 hypothetical protein N7471_006335 [Penicillium samsonianum]